MFFKVHRKVYKIILMFLVVLLVFFDAGCRHGHRHRHSSEDNHQTSNYQNSSSQRSSQQSSNNQSRDYQSRNRQRSISIPSNNNILKDPAYFYLAFYNDKSGNQRTYKQAKFDQMLTGLVYAKNGVLFDYSDLNGITYSGESIIMEDGALVSGGKIRFSYNSPIKEARFVFDPKYIQIKKSHKYLFLTRVYYSQSRAEISKKDPILNEPGSTNGIISIDEAFQDLIGNWKDRNSTPDSNGIDTGGTNNNDEGTVRGQQIGNDKTPNYTTD